MKKYTTEVFLRSEHRLKDGAYIDRECVIEDVLTDVPLMRKQKAFAGIALKFKDMDEVLGLGITNHSLVIVICGDRRPETWIGKTVTIEVREVRSLTGGTEPAIRIMPPKGTVMRSGLVRQLGESYKAK